MTFRFTRDRDVWSNDFLSLEAAIEAAIELFEDEEDFILLVEDDRKSEFTIKIHRKPDPTAQGWTDAREGNKKTYPDPVQQKMYDDAYRTELAIMESGARRLR